MKIETLQERLEDALLANGITPSEKLFRSLEWATFANGITEQQFKVLRLAIGGLSDKEICDELEIHTNTLGLHWRELRKRLGINSRFQIGATVVMRLCKPTGIHQSQK